MEATKLNKVATKLNKVATKLNKVATKLNKVLFLVINQALRRNWRQIKN